MVTDLAEVLEDDSDVHVDDDEECHDEERDEVDDRQPCVAAVTVLADRGRRGIAAWRRVIHQTSQNSVPAGRRTRLHTNTAVMPKT